MTTQEEAKLARDKLILLNNNDKNPTKEEAIKILGVSPDNFDRIRAERDPEFAEKLLLIENYLKNPNLFNEITEKELDKLIVGEVASRKVIFLSACGRLVKNCQTASYNLLVNDDAGTGKDYVTGKTLSIIPREDYIHKTRISPTVFTYWHSKAKEPEWTWDGKVFYPEDISEPVLNSDVFKVMCSSGSTATIVIRQQAVDIEIEGKPVMITTTATATPNPELTRRFSILNLDSSEDQTKAIMRRHSEYKKRGIVPECNQDIINCQKYLERVNVKIPFADLIDKHFPTKNIIMRTLYPRFLDYISASAAFHQYQRKKEGDFILAEGKDYDIARECFIKLCSNKYMIPLTKPQKQILEAFEKNTELKGSTTQLNIIIKTGLTEKSLQYNLRVLVKYGLLDLEEGRDDYNHPVEVYFMSGAYHPQDHFEIPKFEEICRLTSLTSETSVTTLTSLTSVTPDNLEKEGGLEKLEKLRKSETATISFACAKCSKNEGFIILENGLKVCQECAA